MKPTTGYTKRAWVEGRINCPCGNAPASRYGDGNNVQCPCGTLYDSEGWILHQPEPNLFIGVTPTGISYTDKSIEVNGDYKKIAHLYFEDLTLYIYDLLSPLMAAVYEDVARIRARKGEQYQVSTSGQTVTLGYNCDPSQRF